ncbi:hypothetical protein K488DRAFT_80641 [Vararia minispora EC-137]|uniref:Uncharacterized protein n=1 Tax=Vararia minispora EC-137 TaxID=1314806 RepID=A0ACB8QAC0_9AGAM|nr:hypothetical protein K488DRAFT_80641 [Vararia minispora EC-137]
MPSSSFIRAAIFAAGAVVGGGIATVVRRRKEESVPTLVAPPAEKPSPNIEGPAVDVSAKGQLQLTTSTAIAPPGQVVLKRPVSDLLVRKAYVAAYDRRLRHPAWTAEHLTLASLGKSALEPASPGSETGDRQKSAFAEDPGLPTLFRSRLQDYFRSGYDRGHMVPAADAKTSQDAMDETFLLSNIAPQVGDGFNRHYWAYVEDWCRRLTSSFSDVYVFTVPLYIPHKEADGKWRVTYEMIGTPPNVAVPTHFAKVVLTSRPSSPSTPDVPEISTGAFVLPNAKIPDETPLESFIVPVDAVERAAGLTLFSDEIKQASKHICQTSKCQVIVRRFDDARQRAIVKK